ncbi:hypothetical protein A11A3_08795 [Alcanivorax hongdengensis A-11-3]|uniref:DUF4124 domain-containing protein n=1 Tax=Alcanivorax hongdengensis A-11-3 TaxID=1177179 RepID=L0WC37_9GAMM|nr:DUF4124 domain-containing protein [Alcanivorax hongdengensis]EKF74506.1 hypothetical protein A11A3_08795 [Alcanivorax hongdengensis A-11-3]
MKKTTLLLGGVLMVLASSSFAAKFYKWTDENGTTHYDAQPPQDVQTKEVRTYNNASSDQASAIEKLEKQREQAAQERAKAEKQAQEQKRVEDNPDQVAKERCEQHRKNLDILTNKPTVRRKNPDTGEMEVMDQEERQKMIDDTQKALEQCQKDSGQ